MNSLGFPRSRSTAFRGSSFATGAFGWLALTALLLGASGCTSTQTVRYGRDGWRITCGENMSSCAGRADTVCGDKGYSVVGGGTQSSMLGGTNGYQTKTRTSELIVRCGEEGDAAGEESPSEMPPLKLPPRTDEALPAAAPPPAAAPKQSCVPGETRKCVGAGACDGGHACLADGSGYGACDCGGSASPPPSPPSAPSAPDSSSWSNGAPAPSPLTPAPTAPAPRP